MTMTDVWPLADEVRLAISHLAGSTPMEILTQSGLKAPGWVVVFPTFILEPAPSSLAWMMKRIPYSTADAGRDRLASAAEQGLITINGEDTYHLTPKALGIERRLTAAYYAALGQAEPLPAADLARLIRLLNRVSDVCLAAPEPTDKSCLLHERSLAPDLDAPLMAHLDQALSELGAFRDDCHPATWQPLGVTGPAWEAFTLIWRDQATTLDTIYQRVQGRRNPRDAYVLGLIDLAQRGWIETDGDGYRTTEAGREVRQTAEDETNRLFYTPWKSLPTPHIDEIRSYLIALRETLKQPA